MTRARRASDVKAPSALEAMVELQLRALKLPTPVKQYRPFRDRRITLDFAWPDRMLAVEAHGAAHRTKERFYTDAERHNTLLEAGWKVYLVTGRMARSGESVPLLQRILR